MPRKRSIHAFIVSTLLLRVLVLALLNPLCCRYLPTFDAEPPQHQFSIAENECDCPGKPEAARHELKAPVFALALIERLPLPRTPDPARSISPSPTFGHIRCLAPPAHIRFRIFLS
ncbi:hypothetical protein CMV30_10490 [Nibricoccus aquaticus]|uniref:Uncharacterized protein n=1 Tax=Nibricoccus aquaticus TaxID=2576891 RepID=A0A290Q7X2_9BACT|nr:hypothetical protein [Nibricoccus aquaticus]ATC64347.1 hypothetical protein CMV30_10490 [Nibricoccus aquaticus]